MHDATPLRGEEDQDGEEEAEEGEGGGVFEELGVVPVGAGEAAEGEAREEGGGEGDAEEYGYARGDGGIGYVLRRSCSGRRPASVTDHADEEHGQGRIQHHLQHGVDGYEDGAVFPVAAGEARPDEHHGYAPRYADEDQSVPQPCFVGEKGPGQSEHEEGRDDPVEEDGEGYLDPYLLGAEGVVQGFVFHGAEDRVHHDEEAERDGDGDGGEGSGC